MFFVTPKCKHTNIFQTPEAAQEVPSQEKIFVGGPIQIETSSIKSIHSTNA